MEPRLKQLLEELTRSLCEQIAESPEVHERLEAIRREGYTLSLVLDCKPLRTDAETRAKNETKRRRPAPPFRINGRDLAFLRSVGIDPTRKARSRSSRQTER